MSFNSSNVDNFFVELKSKRLYQSSGKEKESRCLVFGKRQLHTTHVGAVGWELHGTFPTTCAGKADQELP